MLLTFPQPLQLHGHHAAPGKHVVRLVSAGTFLPVSNVTPCPPSLPPPPPPCRLRSTKDTFTPPPIFTMCKKRQLSKMAMCSLTLDTEGLKLRRETKTTSVPATCIRGEASGWCLATGLRRRRRWVLRSCPLSQVTRVGVFLIPFALKTVEHEQVAKEEAGRW